MGGGQADPDYPLDGVSLQALLREPGHAFERALLWRMEHRGQRAMREERLACVFNTEKY